MSIEFFIFPPKKKGMGGLDDTQESFSSSLPKEPKSLEDRYNELHAIVEQILIESPLISLGSLDSVTTNSGVYSLFYNGSLSYIGSTHNLRGRLKYHQKSVREAERINLSCATVKIAVCGKHDARSAEGRLIEHYNPEWNSMGFGSKQRFKEPTAWERKYGMLKKSLYTGKQQTNHI